MVDVIIFNGPRVRTVEVSDIANLNVVNVDLTVPNVIAHINNINLGKLIIINTHGTVQGSTSGIQLKDQSETVASTESLFQLFANAAKRTPLTVQLFACMANAACTNQVVSKLPAGSLVGFYAPDNAVSRLEISEKLIRKSVELKAQGMSKEEILWSVAPLAPTSVAYHHPTNGFQYQRLLPDNFIYTTILTQSDLARKKFESIQGYNTFLINNGLNRVILNLIRDLSWFKDTWFMQLVIELTTTGAFQTAIDYLQTMTDADIKNHTTSLCGLPQLNLLEYFNRWLQLNTQNNNTRDAINDLRIVRALTPIYTPVPRQPNPSAQSPSVGSPPMRM